MPRDWMRRPPSSMAADGPLAGATIAFDLDGTLVDTAPDLIGTLNLLLAEAGHPPHPLAEARPFIGHGARFLIERGFQRAGALLTPADVQPLFDRFLVHYREHIADQSRPFPGCEAALDALAADGAALVVCTNKPTDLSQALLERLGLAARFAAILGPDRAPAAKPDPRHLMAAVEAAGGRLDRAILVGDSATDAGAARAAGTGLILVAHGYTETPAAELEPDALIAHFDELPAACLRLLAACEGRAEPL
jgi:phosphoglycolate phosphatase